MLHMTQVLTFVCYFDQKTKGNFYPTTRFLQCGSLRKTLYWDLVIILKRNLFFLSKKNF